MNAYEMRWECAAQSRKNASRCNSWQKKGVAVSTKCRSGQRPAKKPSGIQQLAGCGEVIRKLPHIADRGKKRSPQDAARC